MTPERVSIVSRCFEEFCLPDDQPQNDNESRIGLYLTVAVLLAVAAAAVYGSADLGNIMLENPSIYPFNF